MRRSPHLAGLAGFALVVSAVSPALAGGYPNPGPRDVADAPFTAGAYIIDSGAVPAGSTKQNIATGLKQYGLVYELVKARIPVDWIINPDKPSGPGGAGVAEVDQILGNTAADFSFDCDGAGSAYVSKNYRTGAFVIRKEFAAQAAPIVATWRTRGVVVDGPCTGPTPTLPIFATVAGWPRAVLDAQNGSVAVPYFTNAGISQGSLIDPLNPPAYRTAAPTQLTGCDDLYIMPHADPTYATHSALIDFVKQGGSFYASCHAVSVIENLRYPSGHPQQNQLAMNFLADNGLVNYDGHVQGSVPYAFFRQPGDTRYSTSPYVLDALDSGDPIAQFIGRTDAAQQNGSEQIFMPAPSSKWRSTTQIIMYDPTQANVDANASPGPATSLLYGPAYGDSRYGNVMYEGGHSVNKGTADDVASQRAFFNFLLLNAVDRHGPGQVSGTEDRSPKVVITEPSGSTTMSGGATIPVSGSATSGSGSYSYRWAAACYAADGTSVSGGTFASPTSMRTTFTAPGTVGQVTCNLTLTVIDSCGRFSFAYQTVVVGPSADVQVTQSASSASISRSANVTYTVTVKNNGKTLGTTTNDGNVATSVVVTSSVPAGLSFVSVSSPSFTGSAPSGVSCSHSAGVITCLLGDLADEQVATYSIVYQGITAGTSINIAAAESTSSDANLTNNRDSTSITILNSGIAITNTVNPTMVLPAGGSVTNTFVVSNTGAMMLSSVVVSNPRCLSITGPTGDANTNQLLETTETWTYTCSRTVDSNTTDVDNDSNAATKRDVAEVVANDGSANISASDDAVVAIATPSLTLTKTPSSQIVSSGGSAPFVVTVKNTSNADITLTNIDVTDSFTTGGTLVCSQSGTALTKQSSTSSTAVYRIASLAQNKSWVASCVISGVTSTGTNSLSASASNPLGGSAVTATSSNASVTVGTPRLTVEKSVSPSGPVSPGDVITYRVGVVNNGGTTQSGVVLTDVLPAGLTAGTATVTSTDFSGNVAIAPNGVLAWDKFGNSSYSSGYSGGTGAWSGNWLEYENSSSTNSSTITVDTSKGVTFSSSGTSGTTYSIGRSIVPAANWNEYPSITVIIECKGYSSAPSVSVSLGAATKTSSVCANSSRQRIRWDVPASEFGANNSAKVLRISVPKVSSTFYIDDVYVVAGLAAFDNFALGYGGGEGFGTWTESGDSSSWLSGSSSEIRWYSKRNSSQSNTAKISSSFTIQSSLYQDIKMFFTCRRTFDTGDSLVIKVNSVTKFTQTSSSGTCTGSASPNSNSGNTSVTGISIDGGSNVPIEIIFTGDKSGYLDDLIFTASPKGISSPVAGKTGVSLTSALAGPYSISAGNRVDVEFTATVNDPYDGVNLTDVINVATAVSDSQATPSASLVSSPLATYEVSIEKSVNHPRVLSGSTVIFTYTVKNNGTAAVPNVTVLDTYDNTRVFWPSGGDTSNDGDPNTGDVAETWTYSVTPSGDNGDEILQPNETWTFTRTVTNLTADVTAVTGEVALNGGDAGSPIDELISFATVDVIAPAISLATPSPSTISIYQGRTVTYVYTVSNSGDTPLKNVAVTANNCPFVLYSSGDNGDRVMQTTETWTFTCTTSAVNTSQTNQSVAATATDSLLSSSVTSTTRTVNISVVIEPTLTLTKTVTDNYGGGQGPASTLSVGVSNTIAYQYSLTRAGSDVSSVTLNDDNCASISAPTKSGGDTDATLESGETWSYTCTVGTLAVSTVAIATASGTDVLNNPVQSSKATTSVTVLAPRLILQGGPSAEYVVVGQPVRYNYTIENDGGTNVTAFTPSDDNCSPLVRGDDEVGDNDNVLEIGEKWTYSCTVASFSGDRLSTFTVTSVTDSLGYNGYTPTPLVNKVFAINPDVTVTRLATSYVGNTSTVREGPASNVDSFVGDKIRFDFTITGTVRSNASNVPGLNSLLLSSLQDDDCSTIDPVLNDNGTPSDSTDDYNVGDVSNIGQLDPTEVWEFTCTTLSVTNTAATVSGNVTVNAKSVLDEPSSPDVAKSLTVSATATVRVASLNSPPQVNTTVPQTTVPSTSTTPAPTTSTIVAPATMSEAGQVAGIAWFDTNKNKKRDAGEPSLVGLTIELITGGGNATTPRRVVATSVTDSNGSYRFASIPVGTYQLVANLPSGYGLEKFWDSSGNDDWVIPIIIASTAAVQGDFAVAGFALITGCYSGSAAANQVVATWNGFDKEPGTDDDATFVATIDSDCLFELQGVPTGDFNVAVKDRAGKVVTKAKISVTPQGGSTKSAGLSVKAKIQKVLPQTGSRQMSDLMTLAMYAIVTGGAMFVMSRRRRRHI